MGTLGHSYDGILSKSMGCNETNEISWMKIKMPHHGFANDDRLFWCLPCQVSTKKILLPGSALGPRPVKDIKTEGTWTAIQVEFLNMRILDTVYKWMLISILFPNCGDKWMLISIVFPWACLKTMKKKQKKKKHGFFIILGR